MPQEVIRIFSDLHYGDRSTRIARPADLAPLADGAKAWIINGDSLDTRQGPHPDYNAQILGELTGFLRGLQIPVTQLTGNHDPDISAVHQLDLAGGEVFLTHGDILYPSVIPWSIDAERIGAMIAAELSTRCNRPLTLSERLDVYRTVGRKVSQRHHSERNALIYLLFLTKDLLSPPWRSLRMLEAWRTYPRLVWNLAEQHRLSAKYILTGHSHWSGIWRRPGGPTIINTGAFCRPFRPRVVDLHSDRLVVRLVEMRGREFYPGPVVAELRLDGARR
ncbi:MAG TPA: hypothetical protein VGL42_18250 [Opitutaceae bacterium]|jgi:hypothetical protein